MAFAVDPPPRRIQLCRTKGWRMPRGVIIVDRRTKWGNPFKVGDMMETLDPMRGEMVSLRISTPALAVQAFREAVGFGSTFYEAVFVELRGHDLGCWCPIGAPCHGDVLLTIANGPACEAEVPVYNDWGSALCCERPADHRGDHRDQGIEWRYLEDG